MTRIRPALASLLLGAAILTTAPLSLVQESAFADEITNYVKDGAAIGGTDPVAYFTEHKPVQGSGQFTADYQGVTWKFASAANRDLFQANPAKYAPQYGGFCAFGASKGFKVPVVPNAWKIVDGKLYLNNSPAVQERFLADTSGIIHDADLNWQIIKDKKAEDLKEPIIR
ncbi:YHS domain-containing (seleno)protein [Roseibium litorale]|uniref:YHS domain-containing protein n=1 Tax=Roseibium litorale TaxID=2803841 RepID=A0ABR9CH35_9HYPH|nr:YHS domain-containing (seleno)protein [Roseibium litorale]MBD8890073.1 YHS domain-containing protein [Roseibium litorale]